MNIRVRPECIFLFKTNQASWLDELWIFLFLAWAQSRRWLSAVLLGAVAVEFARVKRRKEIRFRFL